MKKVEVKKISAVSMFKVTIYMMVIPMSLMILLGILATLIGLAVREPGLAGFGAVYIFVPIFIIPFYGLISMLMAVVYSFLSSKFGGLELTLDDKEEQQL